MWIKRLSIKQKAHYWQNQITGASVWEEPVDWRASLPTKSAKPALSLTLSPTPVVAKWTEKWSKKYNKPYWFNESNGSSIWENPTCTKITPTAASKPSKQAQIAAILTELEAEERAAAVYAPDCPRCISETNLPSLVARLRKECAIVKERDVRGKVHVFSNLPKQGFEGSDEEFKAVFTLLDDDTAMITRAIQEDQILKTKLKLKERGKAVDLPSFWDVWFHPSGALKKEILKSSDPNEAKWSNMRPFRYKLATTFMPGYAKALFDYFQAKTVLDPCSGWGDRLTGAMAASAVTKYVGFDPNKSLRPGYAQLLKLFGHDCMHRSEKMLSFSNGFECRAQPFEVGSLELPDSSFDLVFTSPPFFDYEMYNPDNPDYVDWIQDFYYPLMQQSCRLVKHGGHVAIYIGDTSAGSIDEFMRNTVEKICPLKIVYMLGFNGLKSKKVRGIWVYRKEGR